MYRPDLLLCTEPLRDFYRIFPLPFSILTASVLDSRGSLEPAVERGQTGACRLVNKAQFLGQELRPDTTENLPGCHYALRDISCLCKLPCRHPKFQRLLEIQASGKYCPRSAGDRAVCTVQRRGLISDCHHQVGSCFDKDSPVSGLMMLGCLLRDV